MKLHFKLFALIICFAVCFPLVSLAEIREVPFTLDDRDRLIRLEEQYHSLMEQNHSFRNEIIIKFDAQQQQINDLKNAIIDIRSLFYWGFGILITIMFFLLGYIIWDRRTAISPVREKAFSLEEKINTIERVLNYFAKKKPEFAGILRTHGLM